MAIIHTPRTLISIGRGLLRRRQRLASINQQSNANNIADVDAAAADEGAMNASKFIGFVPNNNNNNNNNNKSNPHIYKNKPSKLFDIDYLGHMNNAAYLAHAEYARWEWTAETGALETMYKNNINFIATSVSIRYRKEILMNNKFEIHSILQSMNERHLYMYQTFRSVTNGRILAQVIVQAVVTQNRKVIPPKQVLEDMGLSNDSINSLLLLNNNNYLQSDNDDKEDNDDKNDNDDNDNDDKEDDGLLLKRFEELDQSFREDATNDDKQLLEN